MQPRLFFGVFFTLVAMIFYVLVAEPFGIADESMMPNLLVGDYFLASKYTYGYSHFSVPFLPELFSGRILENLPRRGDVVVFRIPGSHGNYIKRLIGLPGDHISIRGGQIILNQSVISQIPISDRTTEQNGTSTRRLVYKEVMPDGTWHDIYKETRNKPLDNIAEFIVPPEYMFCMGDNRDNSSDTRVRRNHGGPGFVPLENLLGRAEFVFWSKPAPWWAFWTWPMTTRWSRTFNTIT